MSKLPIGTFLEKRLLEYKSSLDVRKGTGFEQLFFKPLEYMLQPVIDELNYLGIAQSFLRIMGTSDPDGFSEEAVDALAYNYFVVREQGGSARGTARVYYAEPVNREWPADGAQFTGSNGFIYSNPAPFSISQAVMSQQIENGSYYYDIPIQSVEKGAMTVLAAGGLVSIDNDPDASYVTNPKTLYGGSERETNSELITRVRKSIAIRDLVTGKGFQATMYERFSGFLRELQTVGFGDPEMMRDIIYNAHIGGKVDAYFKATSIATNYKNIVGLYPDLTRQLHSTTNMVLELEIPTAVRDANFDVSNGKRPVVKQIKESSQAAYFGTVNLTGDNDLSVNHRIKMTIVMEVDGVVTAVTKDFSMKPDVNPTKTSRPQIIAAINEAFGYAVCYSYQRSIAVKSPVSGRESEVTITNSDSGSSALLSVFGLSTPTSYYGDGPVTFIEDSEYKIDTETGSITRIVSDTYLVGTAAVDGEEEGGTISMTSGQPYFTDDTIDIFENVAEYDIITVNPNPDIGETSVDYRVLKKISNNELVIDTIPGDAGYWTPATNTPLLENGKGTEGSIYKVTANGSCNFGAGTIDFLVGEYVIYRSGLWGKLVGPISSDLSYVIRRTGIKSMESVFVEYWFNPLSVDIGPRVWNTDYTVYPPTPYRGVRPGRADYTIIDTSFLKIESIEIIDPLTLEPTGEILVSGNGYGDGGYGEGPYGIGGDADYYMIVNSPHERYSAFEDSVIVFHPSLIAMSVRINYTYAPECVSLHDFVRSESERVLDGDILMKHFIPAYVSGEIYYSVDPTNTSIPDNDTLTESVKEFISSQPAGSVLKISDVYQFLARATDPNDKYGTYIKPFSLSAIIYHVDGTTENVSGNDKLTIPVPFPFPKETSRPLSARIAHWIGDNIVLIRE
jgi:hypothetical protein